MSRFALLTALTAVALSSCSGPDPSPDQYGPHPNLPAQQRGLLPETNIPTPTGWNGELPTVPDGFTVTAIASDLKIPRQTLVLPNGDILVAEGSGGGPPTLSPKDALAGYMQKIGKSEVKGGNRLTILRDADGDGAYEQRGVFVDGLNAPYGLAFANGAIYVANQDSLVRFSYADGQDKAVGKPQLVTALPSRINHHWTKSLAASLDGRTLYVGIGSNSNITERGFDVEVDRALVWEVDAATGAYRAYATGLRNPSALTVDPSNGQLWAAVNERDEIGPNLVPDYITSVREGAFYGWPFSYWGQNVDPRVKPQNPTLVASAVAPDYSIGSHRAPLGIAFGAPSLGTVFGQGIFVGEHGSWNRKEPVGYKVVFVRTQGGKPFGTPIDFLSGFYKDGHVRGRPVGVTVDPKGAVIVADDVANVIWRVVPAATGSTMEEGGGRTRART